MKGRSTSQKYVLLDSLLFKISATTEKKMAVLAIPKTCVDSIIALYHSSLFTGHQGVIKTYLTMNDKFFILNLIHYLRLYIKGVIYASSLEMKNCLADSYKLE